MRFAPAVLVVALLGAAAACGSSTTPTSPTTPTFTAGTATFTSNITPGGMASESFNASAAGTVTVQLAVAGPPPDIVMGLGIGLPHADGTGCTLTQTITTASDPVNPQLSVPVDAGLYCVSIFDVGNQTQPIIFSITIVHP